jgi:hypothetical protein
VSSLSHSLCKMEEILISAFLFISFFLCPTFVDMMYECFEGFWIWSLETRWYHLS